MTTRAGEAAWPMGWSHCSGRSPSVDRARRPGRDSFPSGLAQSGRVTTLSTVLTGCTCRNCDHLFERACRGRRRELGRGALQPLGGADRSRHEPGNEGEPAPPRSTSWRSPWRPVRRAACPPGSTFGKREAITANGRSGKGRITITTGPGGPRALLANGIETTQATRYLTLTNLDLTAANGRCRRTCPGRRSCADIRRR